MIKIKEKDWLGQIALGTRYLKPNSRHVFNWGTDWLAAGLAPGKRACIRRKADGNEDALAVFSRSGEQLMLLADAHFGIRTAEMALHLFLETLLANKEDPEFDGVWTHLLIDQAIQFAKPADPLLLPGCGTTLLSAWLAAGKLTVTSSGDSWVWLCRDGRWVELIEPHDYLFLGGPLPLLEELAAIFEQLGFMPADAPPGKWKRLGHLLRQALRVIAAIEAGEAGAADFAERYRSVLPIERLEIQIGESVQRQWLSSIHEMRARVERLLPRAKSVQVRPGDILLMASDGIDKEMSAVELDVLREIAADRTREPAVAVDEMLAACSTRQGGQDNLAIMLARFSP